MVGAGSGFVLCSPSPLIHHSSLGSITPSFFTEKSSVFFHENEVKYVKSNVFHRHSVKTGQFL